MGRRRGKSAGRRYWQRVSWSHLICSLHTHYWSHRTEQTIQACSLTAPIPSAVFSERSYFTFTRTSLESRRELGRSLPVVWRDPTCVLFRARRQLLKCHVPFPRGKCREEMQMVLIGLGQLSCAHMFSKRPRISTGGGGSHGKRKQTRTKTPPATREGFKCPQVCTRERREQSPSSDFHPVFGQLSRDIRGGN